MPEGFHKYASIGVVREGGLEPPHHRYWYLKPARLPIPPLSLSGPLDTTIGLPSQNGRETLLRESELVPPWLSFAALSRRPRPPIGLGELQIRRKMPFALPVSPLLRFSFTTRSVAGAP